MKSRISQAICIFICRIFARILEGHQAFAEMYALTGPPSGAKSFIVMCLVILLGQGPSHYVETTPANYFTEPPRKGAQAPLTTY